MFMAKRGERGKQLETEEDIIKVLLNLDINNALCDLRSIVSWVNDMRKKEKRKELSERSIRKTLSVLVSSGVVSSPGMRANKGPIVIHRLINPESGDLIESNALRMNYKVMWMNAVNGTDELLLADFKRKISRLPTDVRDELVKIREERIEQDRLSDALEMSILQQRNNPNNIHSKDPNIRLPRDYFYYRMLNDVMAYLKMWKT